MTTAETAIPDQTIEVVTRFENGFNTRDVDAQMADMTEDCVFEHVAPEGHSVGRHIGQAAVRAVWESMDDAFPGYTFEFVDIFADGDKCAVRWNLRWQKDGGEALARGVDIIMMRDGKIAEKLSYVTI